jgi:AcrR family transcriptional regulator
MNDAGAPDFSGRASYRRSTGSNRGQARRQRLLELVTDDLVVNGMVGFSLRRAARAAGATHKVLLYHFDSVDDLLHQAVLRLRERRISDGLAAAAATPSGLADPRGPSTLADRIRAVWPILVKQEIGAQVLDQAIGLAMYDPQRHGELGREATSQYLPSLLSICPPQWSDRRKLEVAEMILATLRGFLVHWRTTGDLTGIDPGFAALARALDREEAACD